jgi:hypothetical protein
MATSARSFAVTFTFLAVNVVVISADEQRVLKFLLPAGYSLSYVM